jgi:hypothetical protein
MRLTRRCYIACLCPYPAIYLWPWRQKAYDLSIVWLNGGVGWILPSNGPTIITSYQNVCIYTKHHASHTESDIKLFMVWNSINTINIWLNVNYTIVFFQFFYGNHELCYRDILYDIFIFIYPDRPLTQTWILCDRLVGVFLGSN